jgi:hypothetical protein
VVCKSDSPGVPTAPEALAGIGGIGGAVAGRSMSKMRFSPTIDKGGGLALGMVLF